MSKLKELRQAKRMTQAVLAAKAGIPLRALQKYEYGETQLENMTLEKGVALADALDVHPRELLKK